jgi:hypothetical protein
VFEVPALESINIAESGSSKVTDDAFALTAADYRDISFPSWLLQQQVTRTLVNWKQAIAAKNNLLLRLSASAACVHRGGEDHRSGMLCDAGDL